MPTVLFIPPETLSAAQAVFNPSFGARAFEPRPAGVPAKNPQDVYMLYLSVRDTGLFRRQYRRKRGASAANSIAKDLYDLAVQNDSTYEVGQNLVKIEWSEPCHLYIVLDIDGCSFVDDTSNEDYDPLHFHESKAIGGTGSTVYFDRNASFYEGRILPDNVVGAPTYYCINHFTDEHGKPLWHPRLRTYGFEIRYETPSGRDVVDPDGQNQGPPA